MDIIRSILSILIPPFGVFTKVGLGLAFWVNLVLTGLFYFPGVLHALWVVNRHPASAA